MHSRHDRCDAEGKKELVGFTDGCARARYRGAICCLISSGAAWRRAGTCVADGALGFWKALGEVWPTTREQRCWVHKTANVLNKLPKSRIEGKRACRHLDGRDKEEASCLGCLHRKLRPKYDKAVDCEKDRDTLLSFYDFPAEHWKHLNDKPNRKPCDRAAPHDPFERLPLEQDALAMVFKLATAPEKLASLTVQQLPKVIEGEVYRWHRGRKRKGRGSAIPGPVSCNERETESALCCAVTMLMTRCLGVVIIASREFCIRLMMTSRSCPMLPWIVGNSESNIVWVTILWSSSSLRKSCIASSANTLMSTGLYSCLPPLNKLRKPSNTSLARKAASFIWSKRVWAFSILGSGGARFRNRLPAAAREVMPVRGCLTSWASAATTASTLVSLFGVRVGVPYLKSKDWHKASLFPKVAQSTRLLTRAAKLYGKRKSQR